MPSSTITVKKLDYRYNYYNVFSHVLIVHGARLRREIVNRLTEMYGPRAEWVETSSRSCVMKFNENYRYEEKKKRIFVKTAEDATLLTLIFSQQN